MLKRIAIWIIGTIVLTSIITIGIYVHVSKSSDEYIYADIDKIPSNKVGLLLGTSKYLASGAINHYYSNRIEAALDLYMAGKIQIIIISGDNSRKDYNEPVMMKNDLISLGVDPKDIFLDYAGFRTLDSVVRCDKIFGQKNFTVISQEFHNERAIFLARRNGLDAIGYNAKEVSKYFGFKTSVRERLARVKMIIDLAIQKQPKYLGETVDIDIDR